MNREGLSFPSALLLVHFRGGGTDAEMNRLWSGVTAAIKNKDHEKATIAKTLVEDGARDSSRLREEGGAPAYVPKYFKLVRGEWRCKFE